MCLCQIASVQGHRKVGIDVFLLVTVNGALSLSSSGESCVLKCGVRSVAICYMSLEEKGFPPLSPFIKEIQTSEK